MDIIKKKLSIRDVLNILNQPYEVKRLRMSRGAFNFLPKRALRSLTRMNIHIDVVDLKRGPQVTVDSGKIRMLYKSDVNAYEISKRLKVPLRTVYYHISKIKKEDRRKPGNN